MFILERASYFSEINELLGKTEDDGLVLKR